MLTVSLDSTYLYLKNLVVPLHYIVAKGPWGTLCTQKVKEGSQAEKELELLDPESARVTRYPCCRALHSTIYSMLGVQQVTQISHSHTHPPMSHNSGFSRFIKTSGIAARDAALLMIELFGGMITVLGVTSIHDAW